MPFELNFVAGFWLGMTAGLSLWLLCAIAFVRRRDSSDLGPPETAYHRTQSRWRDPEGRCTICRESYDVWPRCLRPDCHDGR